MSIEDEVYEAAREAAREEFDRLDLIGETTVEEIVERYVRDVEDDYTARIDELTSQLEQACKGSAERIDALNDLDERLERLEHVTHPEVGGWTGTEPIVEANVPEHEGLNDEQRRYIFGLLSEVNGGVQCDRGTRLMIVGHIVGHPVTSLNNLTEFEADEVIGQLNTILWVNEQVRQAGLA